MRGQIGKFLPFHTGYFLYSPPFKKPGKNNRNNKSNKSPAKTLDHDLNR